MALTQTIDVNEELAKAPAEMEKRIAALQGARLHKQIARGVAQNVFIPHFVQLDSERANELGGQRSHFYGNTAKSVSSGGDAEGATVTMSQLGLRQRLEGGEIKPRQGKYLTIPARSEAYGKRAREFDDLEFVKLSGGRGMLVRKATGAVSERADVGVIYYWLVPSVLQTADPSVLPNVSTIDAEARRIIAMAWAFSEQQRKENN